MHFTYWITNPGFEVRSEFPQLLFHDFHASISDALKACTYSKTGAVTSVQMSRGKLDSLTPLPRCGIVGIVQFA